MGRQAVTTPAHSSPNDHPAGAILLYVGSLPRFKNSMRTTDMTHVLFQRSVHWIRPNTRRGWLAGKHAAVNLQESEAEHAQ